MEKKEDLMFDVTDIVRRAKLALDLKKDSELAQYLGARARH